VDSSPKAAFEAYLYQDNKEGSGKASSYLKALHWLHEMLGVEAFGFEDALDLWSMTSVDRLARIEPVVPDVAVREPGSKDGKDRIREAKTRIGQHAFREVILDSLREYFLSKAGTRIELPPRFRPLEEYLEVHRSSGEF
jgi:hypothetical protein